MKTIHTLLSAFLFCTFFISCSKDDDEVVPPTANITAQLFENTAVMENSPTLDFKINFDKPATANGFILLNVESSREGAFQTFPAVIDGEIEIPVVKGSRFATLQFSPEDNQVLEENEIVTLELLDSSEGINFGSKRTTTIEITDNEAAVSAYFYTSSLTASEIYSEGIQVRIELSAPAPGQGTILLQLDGDNDSYYLETYPAMDNQRRMVLSIEPGSVYTTFQLLPKNNTALENHKTFKLRIVEAGGVVIKGSLAELDILLLDDEIQGKLKSMETITDGKRTKKTWEYASNGKISKVRWENQSPQLITGTNNYYYDNDGKLLSISMVTGDAESYIWNGGKVVLSEKINNFFKVGYSTYEYDTNGRIQKKTDFVIKAGGEFDPEASHVYEYYADGNLKKHSTYVRDHNSNWVLNASLAFSQYSNQVNPAPLEIYPTFNIQQHLPVMFYVNGEGINFSHYYAYTFNAQGLVTQRTTMGETTNYEYY